MKTLEVKYDVGSMPRIRQEEDEVGKESFTAISLRPKYPFIYENIQQFCF